MTKPQGMTNDQMTNRDVAFSSFVLCHLLAIFTISLNSGSANGMTDKRDWRTSGIPFSGEWLLISRRLTGRRSGLTGTRSTVDQSPSFAVESGYAVRITFAIPTTALFSPL